MSNLNVFLNKIAMPLLLLELYRNLQSKIESLGNSFFIIGGDWNVLLNYSRDTINYLHQNNEKSHKQI
jgi:hypothetical protein